MIQNHAHTYDARYKDDKEDLIAIQKYANATCNRHNMSPRPQSPPMSQRHQHSQMSLTLASGGNYSSENFPIYENHYQTSNNAAVGNWVISAGVAGRPSSSNSGAMSGMISVQSHQSTVTQIRIFSRSTMFPVNRGKFFFLVICRYLGSRNSLEEVYLEMYYKVSALVLNWIHLSRA